MPAVQHSHCSAKYFCWCHPYRRSSINRSLNRLNRADCNKQLRSCQFILQHLSNQPLSQSYPPTATSCSPVIPLFPLLSSLFSSCSVQVFKSSSSSKVECSIKQQDQTSDPHERWKKRGEEKGGRREWEVRKQWVVRAKYSNRKW